ncbi:hypothetical protein TNCV_3455911 [Trichonephila clavipes]|nr:hypothetical protein TNCV_3455911 [Trichonephila clavipes]
MVGKNLLVHKALGEAKNSVFQEETVLSLDICFQWDNGKDFKLSIRSIKCMFKGAGLTEELMRRKSVKAQSPLVGVVWKLRVRVPAQVSSSSLDRSSKYQSIPKIKKSCHSHDTYIFRDRGTRLHDFWSSIALTVTITTTSLTTAE